MRLYAFVAAAAMLSASLAAHADTIGLPSPDGNSYPYARGYFFTSPTAITITGLQVLGSTGTEYVELIAFNSPPAVFPSSGTNFTVLNYASAPGGTEISVNDSIAAGEMVGVLGWDTGCNCTRYGSPNPYLSSINGIPVELNRLLTQRTLDSPAGSVVADYPGDVNEIGLTQIAYSSSVTPEPSSIALLGTGLLGLAGVVRKCFANA